MPVGEVPFATVGAEGASAETGARSSTQPSSATARTNAGAPATCSVAKVPGTLARPQVVAVVEQGLGRWLGNIEVSPVRRNERFVGWRIEAIADPCYQDAGIAVGDVVTRVNGASLETPEKANAVFLDLKTAPRLEVQLLRAGKPRTLTWPIDH